MAKTLRFKLVAEHALWLNRSNFLLCFTNKDSAHQKVILTKF